MVALRAAPFRVRRTLALGARMRFGLRLTLAAAADEAGAPSTRTSRSTCWAALPRSGPSRSSRRRAPRPDPARLCTGQPCCQKARAAYEHVC